MQKQNKIKQTLNTLCWVSAHTILYSSVIRLKINRKTTWATRKAFTFENINYEGSNFLCFIQKLQTFVREEIEMCYEEVGMATMFNISSIALSTKKSKKFDFIGDKKMCNPNVKQKKNLFY